MFRAVSVRLSVLTLLASAMAGCRGTVTAQKVFADLPLTVVAAAAGVLVLVAGGSLMWRRGGRAPAQDRTTAGWSVTADVPPHAAFSLMPGAAAAALDARPPPGAPVAERDDVEAGFGAHADDVVSDAGGMDHGAVRFEAGAADRDESGFFGREALADAPPPAGSWWFDDDDVAADLDDDDVAADLDDVAADQDDDDLTSDQLGTADQRDDGTPDAAERGSLGHP